MLFCYAVREALAEGEAKGKAEGKAEGKGESQREIAKNLLGLGADTDMISKATGLSEEEIKAL